MRSSVLLPLVLDLEDIIVPEVAEVSVAEVDHTVDDPAVREVVDTEEIVQVAVVDIREVVVLEKE